MSLVLGLIVSLSAPAQTVEVNFVDVGGANCIVAKIPKGSGFVWAIFDAGTELMNPKASNDGKRAIQRLLGTGSDKQEVDLMVLSHADFDHVSIADWVMNEYTVRRVIYPNRATNQTYADVLAAIPAQAAEPIGMSGASHGETRTLGDATYKILSGFDNPPADWPGLDQETSSNQSSYRNAPSIVVRLDFGKSSVIFPGDAQGGNGASPSGQMKWAEKYMVDKFGAGLEADVLVAGHHGADDASYTDFIKKVKPRYVVFSAGHKHKHPRATTVQRFLSTGVTLNRLLRTDEGDNEGSTEWVREGTPTGKNVSGDQSIRMRLRRNGTITSSVDKNLCDP